MRALWKLTLVQMKLYLREPTAAFFTILYAPMMLILFGFIYGNDPTPFFGGRGTIDVSVPAYIGLIIVTVGLMSVPISTASNREVGILRRFRATPLRPIAYLVASVVGYFVMTLLGVLLLVLVGKVGYNVRFEGHILSVMAGFTLGALSFFSLGYLIAGLAPTARIAQTVGMVVAFPMMFISGATIPLETLPESVRNVARFIPLTHVVILMRGLWFGEGWGEHLTEVAVLVGVLTAGVIVSAKTFRWE
ncbi:MAG: ABC transporter permease [Anaerolineae bacterium]